MKEKEREEIIQKEAQRSEKIRRRMEREERRRQRKLSRKNVNDEEEMNRRIAIEERKLLVAQRKLESIRMLDELLERVKVILKFEISDVLQKSVQQIFYFYCCIIETGTGCCKTGNRPTAAASVLAAAASITSFLIFS